MFLWKQFVRTTERNRWEKNHKTDSQKGHWTSQVDQFVLSAKCAVFTTHVSMHCCLPRYNTDYSYTYRHTSKPPKYLPCCLPFHNSMPCRESSISAHVCQWLHALSGNPYLSVRSGHIIISVRRGQMPHVQVLSEGVCMCACSLVSLVQARISNCHLNDLTF